MKYTNTNPNTNQNTNQNTTSFLKTVRTSDIDQLSLTQTKFEQKDVEEIIIKYLNLKKKINLFWNKID